MSIKFETPKISMRFADVFLRVCLLCTFPPVPYNVSPTTVLADLPKLKNFHNCGHYYFGNGQSRAYCFQRWKYLNKLRLYLQGFNNRSGEKTLRTTIIVCSTRFLKWRFIKMVIKGNGMYTIRIERKIIVIG